MLVTRERSEAIQGGLKRPGLLQRLCRFAMTKVGGEGVGPSLHLTP